MTRPARTLFVAALVVGALFPCNAAIAQLSAGYSVASFQLNLSNPGARSLAMGGAFAGLADDATAAYANPAGLTILTRPEFSFEGRTAKFRLPLISAEPNLVTFSLTNLQDGEILSQGLTGLGVIEPSSLGVPDASESTASFISLVQPVRRWTFALYRHQLVDLKASGARTLPTLSRALKLGDIALERTRSASTSASAAIDIFSLGLAAAYRFDPRVSFGVTLVRNSAEIVSSRSGESLEEEVALLGQETANLLQSDDSDFTLNAGLLIRPNDRWAIGVVYRQGPSFRLDDVEAVTYSEDIAALRPIQERFPPERFDVPDVFSVGASVRATASLVATFEWSRVRYSSLRLPARLPRPLSFWTTASIQDLGRPSPTDIGHFNVDDANELRTGFEYSFWRAPGTPAVRLGVWLDPDHQIRFSPTEECPDPPSRVGGSYECDVSRVNESGALPDGVIEEALGDVTLVTVAESFAQLFPPGKDRVHLTGGVGVVLRSRYQLDAAVDYVSSDQYTFSLSGVVRF